MPDRTRFDAEPFRHPVAAEPTPDSQVVALTGPEIRAVRHDARAMSPAKAMQLQRLAGNRAVSSQLGRAAGRRRTLPVAQRLARLPIPGKPALYVGARHATVMRKASNLPLLDYSGTALMGKAKVKKAAFLAIQSQVVAYNAESGDSPADLMRHQGLLQAIRAAVANWVDTYGKTKAGDAVHKKQRYAQFTLPQALNAEIQANEKLTSSARPAGAGGGVAMPGMSPVRRPAIPAPPPASGGMSRPLAPASASGSAALASVRPGGVAESKEPAPPSAEEAELTDFQLAIVSAYNTMQARDADDDASLAARAYLQVMHANLASFGTSIMGGGLLDEKGRPMAGSRVKDLLQLKAALAAIQSNSNEELYALLDIPKPDEKELGLGDVSAKLATANQAIADLGAITPAIAQKFASAATITKVAAKAKSLAKAGAGAGMSFVPVPGVSQAFSAAMAINTVRSTLLHLRNLKKIQVMALSKGDTEMVELLDYIIGKKESKAKKAGAGGVPLVGAASAAAYALKGAYKLAKGTAGKGRGQSAAGVIDAAKNNNLEAQMVIMELVDSVEEYKQVLLGGPGGAEILANKMKSS